MNHCPDSARLQEWLDGELGDAEAARVEAHVEGCAACAADVEAFRLVFADLHALPLLEPSPELHTRIMDAVLPQRVPQWVRMLGWAYAASLVASAVLLVLAFLLPGPSDWMHGIVAAGMTAFARTGVFVMRSLTETLTQIGSAAHLVRLCLGIVMQPIVLAVVAAAFATCAALFWWMRPRERREAREVTHVGLLGI